MAIQEKYINPLTDFGFKKLFGSEPNKDLLIDFLNQILPEKHKIKDLTYAQNEHLSHNNYERNAIFDIYCVANSGERFIVEIQKVEQKYFKDRSVYYASFPIQEQAKKGKWNFKLEPVYTVGILNFTFDETNQDDEIVHLVELKDQNCEVFYDKLKFIYIELPKFNKSENDLVTHFDKWLFVFKYLSILNDRPKKLQEKIFTKLFEAAEIAKYNPNDRKAYEHSLKVYRDITNSIDTAEEKGVKKGIKKGLINVATNMLNLNIDLETISKSTGLTVDEIKQLKNDL